MMKILESIRRFDAYPKTLELRIQTYGGATITVISVILMAVLFCIELSSYLELAVTEDLMVDVSRHPTIQIRLDVVVPSISCDFLALDAMDSSGEQHLQIDHNIYKRRLDLQGSPIEEPKRENITIQAKNVTELVKKSNSTECGSCYGASDKCCNTCDEVREAYRQKSWAFPDNPENISQCKDEKFTDKLKDAFSQGCQIYGSLTVNRVSGSFHIAPGKSFSINHVHVHDVQPFSSTSFNTSHIIRHLTFDSSIDSELHNPLKNAKGTATEGATMFQYYLKIIPIMYVSQDEKTVNYSNHFSVTKHQKVVSLINGESGMPGIFFQYEFSPMMILRKVQSKSLGHFLTNVCAIIGGVYTVAGLVDSLLYHSITLLEKKLR